MRHLPLLLTSLFAWSHVASANDCRDVVAGAQKRAPLNSELEIYESARMLALPAKGQAPNFDHGWTVVARDANGRAQRVQVTTLVDNVGYNGQIFLVGPFNNWGQALRAEDALRPVPGKPHLFSATVTGLAHGMPYRILLNGKQVLDPTAVMYTSPEWMQRENAPNQYLNSVFWDLRDPSLYQRQTDFVDISSRPGLIGEVELHSLVARWGSGPRTTADTYRFIAESGVIAKLKEGGYTAVEMMPFNQSVDGDSWHLRYQSYGLRAPDSRYGSPTEFKMMIDEFHRQGIEVIMDVVISHFPFKGNQGVRQLQGIGLDQWFKADGRKLFVGPMSPWDTYRYDYANPFVRKFLIESVTFMMSEYGVGGIRIDNTDGILGTDGGAQLLKDLVTAVREVNPRALVIGEAFFPPNTLLQRADRGGYGFNTRNNSNFFELWKEGLQGPTEALNINAMRETMRNIWSWLETPMMYYLTNHDEAANGRGGLTGAYPASLIGGDPWYAFSKTKVADGLNMMMGAYHLSLPQGRMMQEGTFYSNPAIDWAKLGGGHGRNLWEYFAALSRYMQWRAGYFNFASLTRDMENHTDTNSGVLSIKRRDPDSGKELFVLVNLSHRRFDNYEFGVTRGGAHHLGFDSEWQGFGGGGDLQRALPRGKLNADNVGRHGKPFSLRVPVVAPYSLTIIEQD